MTDTGPSPDPAEGKGPNISDLLNKPIAEPADTPDRDMHIDSGGDSADLSGDASSVLATEADPAFGKSPVNTGEVRKGLRWLQPGNWGVVQAVMDRTGSGEGNEESPEAARERSETEHNAVLNRVALLKHPYEHARAGNKEAVGREGYGVSGLFSSESDPKAIDEGIDKIVATLTNVEDGGFEKIDDALGAVHTHVEEMAGKGVKGVTVAATVVGEERYAIAGRAHEGQVAILGGDNHNVDGEPTIGGNVIVAFSEEDSTPEVSVAAIRLKDTDADNRVIFLSPTNLSGDHQYSKDEIHRVLNTRSNDKKTVADAMAEQIIDNQDIEGAADVLIRHSGSDVISATQTEKFRSFAGRILQAKQNVQKGVSAKILEASIRADMAKRRYGKDALIGVGGLATIAGGIYLASRGLDIGGGGAEDVATSSMTPFGELGNAADTTSSTIDGSTSITDVTVPSTESADAAADSVATTRSSLTTTIPEGRAGSNGIDYNGSGTTTLPASETEAGSASSNGINYEGYEGSVNESAGGSTTAEAADAISSSELSGETQKLELTTDRPELENGMIQDRFEGMDDVTAHKIMVAIAGKGGEFADYFADSDQFRFVESTDPDLADWYEINTEVVQPVDGTYALDMPQEVMERIDELAKDPDALQDALDSMGEAPEPEADPGVDQFEVRDDEGNVIETIDLDETNAVDVADGNGLTQEWVEAHNIEDWAAEHNADTADLARRAHATARLRLFEEFEFLHRQHVLYGEDLVTSPGRTYLGKDIVKLYNDLGENPARIWSEERIAREIARLVEAGVLEEGEAAELGIG